MIYFNRALRLGSITNDTISVSCPCPCPVLSRRNRARHRFAGARARARKDKADLIIVQQCLKAKVDSTERDESSATCSGINGSRGLFFALPDHRPSIPPEFPRCLISEFLGRPLQSTPSAARR